MRFPELICFSLLLALFSSLCSSFLFQVKRLNSHLEEIRAETNSLIFISQSFCNTCKGKGFKSLEEWEGVCSALWKLEKIEWTSSEVKNFDEEKSRLIHGSWSGPYGSGEVYAKK